MALSIAALFVLFVLFATQLQASPITSTLDGCVHVTDTRLAEASWFANGTFQAVAFDDAVAGCDATISLPVFDVFVFDEDRGADTLRAQLNLLNLPTCGRRQYDLHFYLADGALDPHGLRSLVIDTGVDCATQTPPAPTPVLPRPVPEPPVWLLGAASVCLWAMRYR